VFSNTAPTPDGDVDCLRVGRGRAGDMLLLCASLRNSWMTRRVKFPLAS
jgi:hypothetical protein